MEWQSFHMPSNHLLHRISSFILLEHSLAEYQSLITSHYEETPVLPSIH